MKMDTIRESFKKSLDIYKEVNDKPKGFENLSLFYDVYLKICEFLGEYKP